MDAETCMNLAGKFLENHGRKLDIRLYEVYFKGGSHEAVLKALAAYQNPDGGFGHALEPDVRMGSSSILATTVAFQLMRPLGVSHHHEIVQRGIGYLLNSFNPKKRGWEIVPPNVDEAPHAPWWKYSGDLQLQWANPRAEIVGYLYEYEAITPAEMREALLTEILAGMGKAETLEMHEVQCFVRLLEAPNLPAHAKNAILEKLVALLPTIVETNPDEWDGYCLRPLGVVSSPTSPLFEHLESAIDRNLQYLIRQQHADGYWSPAWSWAAVDAAAWSQALADLRSSLTLSNLVKLYVFALRP
jgi:hypothetical protein